MPSLKFSNLIRRRAGAPSLKDRAAALKASAARVMRRGAPAAAPVISAPPAGADPRLVALVERCLDARRALNDPAIPDGPEADALGETETRLLLEILRFPSQSAHDLAAKLPFLREEAEDAGRGWDTRRGVPFEASVPGAAWAGLLRDIEHLAGVTPAVEIAPDPILAAIEASKAAHAARDAWAQRFNGGTKLSAADFAEEDELNGVQYATHAAVIATVPTTAAGRLALLEYLRWQMGLYGMADGQPPEAHSAFWPDAYKALKTALAFESAPQVQASQQPASLADQILAAWREYGTDIGMGDEEESEATRALSGRRYALIDAAEALPPTPENVPVKALALAWLEYVDSWQNGQTRDAYSIDGRLALDIDTAICGRLLTEF